MIPQCPEDSQRSLVPTPTHSVQAEEDYKVSIWSSSQAQTLKHIWKLLDYLMLGQVWEKSEGHMSFWWWILNAPAGNTMA